MFRIGLNQPDQRFVLFCKSYKNDVLRVKRLLESVIRFNLDCLPFYLSVPLSDFAMFQTMLETLDFSPLPSQEVTLLCDEEIVRSNPNASLEDYTNLSGYLSQQVIKSDAWRLIGCENYLCLDSDAYFIRDFFQSDFFAPNGNLLSLLHESEELLTEAQQHNKHKVLENFKKDCTSMKQEFGRVGPDFDFGPPPMIWSSKVWASLETFHLKPHGENLYHAIKRLPHEIRWYGEALLKFKAIPVEPSGPLFRFYHYRWQIKGDPAQQALKEGRLGVVIQSNWDKDMDPAFARKSWISRWWRRIRGR